MNLPHLPGSCPTPIRIADNGKIVTSNQLIARAGACGSVAAKNHRRRLKARPMPKDVATVETRVSVGNNDIAISMT
jgi:carbamate kinase